MTITSAREFLACVKPDNYEQAVKGLSGWQERALWEWVEKHPEYWNSYEYDALMADNREGQIIWEKQDFLGRYFRDNPQKYLDFAVEKGLVDLPDLWRWERNLTLSEVEERLKPVTPPGDIAFGLGNGYNNDEYRKAIKILQANINCEITGFYDTGTAIQLYKKKDIFIPSGKGYLAHEVDPDLLFDYHYEPQVYGVNMDLWRHMQFFYQDLTRDSNESYWRKPPLSSAVHDPIDYGKIIGENLDGILGDTGGAFSHMGDWVSDIAKSWDETLWDGETAGKLAKTYHIPGKFLDGISTFMELTEPVQAYVEAGNDDRGQLVYDTSIKAAQVTTKKYLGRKIVKIALKTVVKWGGGPVSYVITGVFLDDEIDKLLDKYIFENEALKEFLTEKVLEPLREFMDPLNEEWQRQHEEDLREGRRMD